MKKSDLHSTAFMKRFAIVAILILLLAPSCVNRKDKTSHEDLIPEREFVSILTEVYLANGLLTIPEIKRHYAERDSVLNFIDVIESHGYSYAKMNSTMNYYFVTKPKKLIRIYDQIIGKLSETEAAMQREIERLGMEESRKQSMYNIYHFPDASSAENPAITINIPSPGIYTITLSVTVFPDDQAYNPHLSAWLVDADSLETGRKKWLPDLRYIKDGHRHQYVYTGRIEEKRPMVMKAILYEFDNNIGEWERNATIEVQFSGFTAIR